MFERFEVIRNADMRQYTTLRLGGAADWLAFPRSGEEIAALSEEAGRAGMPVTVIGHGSNLLVLDGGIRGLVIRVEKNMRGIRREGIPLRSVLKEFPRSLYYCAIGTFVGALPGAEKSVFQGGFTA